MSCTSSEVGIQPVCPPTVVESSKKNMGGGIRGGKHWVKGGRATYHIDLFIF